MSESELNNNAIVYSYPCGMVDIICASDKTFTGPGWELAENYRAEGEAKPAPREAGKKSEGEDRERSMRRARANLRRLALANQFDWFVTLTLDKTKVDRYDPAAIMKTMNRWLDNMVRRHGLRYVLVPELHELEKGHTERAYHFHGFFAGDGLEVIDSGTIKLPGVKKPKRPRNEEEREQWLQNGGHVVYNLPQWPLGFTTAIGLYGEYGSAVAYICKYVGKQHGERPMGRWYYSGGALAKPEKTYCALDYRGLIEDFGADCAEFEIPGSKMLVIHTGGK